MSRTNTRAELELAKLELDGERAGRIEATKLLEGDTDEPRWKWILLAISNLKSSLAREATEAEHMRGQLAAALARKDALLREALPLVNCLEAGLTPRVDLPEGERREMLRALAVRIKAELESTNG